MSLNDPQATAAHTVPQPAQQAALRFAILDLMGHKQVAGRISEETFGGAHLIRVDVPEVATTSTVWRDGERIDTMEVIPAHARSLAPAAVYSIHWCDELAATVAAHDIKHQPVNAAALARGVARLPCGLRDKLLALAAS